MARAAANTRPTNQFSPLTLDDLADVAAAVPPRAPIGQGETVAVADVALLESADLFRGVDGDHEGSVPEWPLSDEDSYAQQIQRA